MASSFTRRKPIYRYRADVFSVGSQHECHQETHRTNHKEILLGKLVRRLTVWCFKKGRIDFYRGSKLIAVVDVEKP